MLDNSFDEIVDSAIENFQDNRTFKLFPKIVTEEFREYFKNKYPLMFSSPELINMMEYLLLGSFIDHETKKLIISRNILATIENKIQDLNNNKYYAIHFLRKIKKILPNFEWSDFNKEKARQVKNRGFDLEDENWIFKNIQDKNKTEIKKIFFNSGELVTEKKLYKIRKELDEKYEEDIRWMNLLDEQKTVINYLENLDNKLFSRLINKNYEKTLLLKDQLEYSASKPGSKLCQERILDAIKDNPKPHYQANNESKSVRISHAGECFLGLKRELRKSLCSGCYEADLKSSQFAIAAVQYKSKVAQDFIKSGKNLWIELNKFIKGNDKLEDLDKRVMKDMFYSIIFGRPRNAGYDIDNIWNPGLYNILKGKKLEKMLDFPVIKDLLIQRDKWFLAIEKNRGWNDAFRQFQKHTNGRTIKSIAASVIQSVEFRIIAPIFKFAENNKYFTIISFQHDGFNFIAHDKRIIDKIKLSMQEIINQSSAKYNITTCLEFTKLGEDNE